MHHDHLQIIAQFSQKHRKRLIENNVQAFIKIIGCKYFFRGKKILANPSTLSTTLDNNICEDKR
jgi:hypothetical protein